MSERELELVKEARTEKLGYLQTRVYVDLFMKRFPDENMGIKSYRAEWAERVKESDLGIKHADGETASRIKKTIKDTEKFCVCCGRSMEEIFKELMVQEPKDGKLEWKGHYLNVLDDVWIDQHSCTIAFCEDCGTELSDEDFKTSYESRGEFWGAPCSEQVLLGYTCHDCGYVWEN